MRAENTDGLAGLHQQRFIVFQGSERRNNRVIALPIARRFSAPAIDDQIFRLFGDFRIEVVHQHAHGRFLLPAFAGKSGATRRANRLISGCVFGRNLRHRKPPGTS